MNISDLVEESNIGVLLKKNEEYFNLINFYDLIKTNPKQLLKDLDKLLYLPLFKQEHLFNIALNLSPKNAKISKVLNNYSIFLKNAILKDLSFFIKLNDESILKKTFIENNKKFIDLKKIKEFEKINNKYIFDYKKLILNDIIKICSNLDLYLIYYEKDFLLDKLIISRFIFNDFKDFDKLNELVKIGLDLNNLNNKNSSIASYSCIYILKEPDKYFKLGFDPNLMVSDIHNSYYLPELIKKFNEYQKNILLNNLNDEINTAKIKDKRKI